MIQNGEQNFGTSATRRDILHYGIKRRSGRYPYGSGERPFQHTNAAKKVGMSMFLSKHDNTWKETTVYRDKNGNIQSKNAAEIIKEFESGSGNFNKEYIIEDEGQEFYDYVVNDYKDRGGNIPFSPFQAYNSGIGRSIENNSPYEDTYDKCPKANAKRINPDFGEDGTTNNCVKCVSAWEVSNRGYSVYAGRQTNPTGIGAAEYWFDGVEKDVRGYDELEDGLRKFGKYARGEVDFSYEGTSTGHAMAFEVDSDNVVHFYDPQANGASFDSKESLYNAYNFNKKADVSIYRLDNATPNWDHMAEDSVIRAGRINSKYFIDTGDGGFNNCVENKEDGRRVSRW